MRATHWIGLLLWRGGLLLAAATAVFEGVRFALRFIDLPRILEVGTGLVLTGLVLVLASVLLERVGDARSEGDLRL